MASFLFRNLKGYRFLVVLAVAMTFAQVGADILLALPILYISNKIQFPLNPRKIHLHFLIHLSVLLIVLLHHMIRRLRPLMACKLRLALFSSRSLRC